MKRRPAVTALLFLAASGLLQVSTVSTTGTDYTFMMNPASIYRPDPGEVSFLIVPYEEALVIFDRSDYDDCSKILNTFREILFRRMVVETPGNYAGFGAETERIARLISETFNTPYRLATFQKQMRWSADHASMRLEEDARFRKCSRLIYSGDLSGEIPAILEEDIRLMEEAGDESETGYHLDLLASYHFAMKDDETGFMYLSRAGENFSRHGNKPALAQHEGRMAEYYRRKGDMQKAEDHLMQSLFVARDMNDSYYTARAYSFLGSMRREQGCFFEAESLLTQSLECCENSNRIDCRSSQYLSLARLYYEFGQHGLSAYNLEMALNEIETMRRNVRESYDTARNVYLENTAAVSTGTCLSLKTRILMEEGQIGDAVKTMERTLPLIDRCPDRHLAAGLEKQLGDVYCAAGRSKDAKRRYFRSLEISTRLGEKKEIAGQLVALSRLYMKTGDIDRAGDCAHAAVRLASDSGDWMVQSEALHASGLLELEKGEAEKGYDLISDAATVFEREYSARNAASERKTMRSALGSIYSDIFTLQAETFRDVDSLLWWAEKHLMPSSSPAAGERKTGCGRIGDVIGDLSWIPAEAVVIRYVATPERLHIIVTGRDGSISVPVEIPYARLNEKAARFHDLCSPMCVPRTGGGAAPSREEIMAASGELYDILIRPVSGSLEGVKTVCFIPDDPLDHMPFHALADMSGDPVYLAEGFDIITSGSLCRLHDGYAMESKADRTADSVMFRRPLLVGALEYSSLARRMFPHVVDLPGSAQEMNEAARLLDGAAALRGRDATKEAFLLRAPESDLVLVSTHTVEYPVFSGETALLLSSSATVRSEMDLSRTILTADEISKTDFSGSKLVVLSTCESACGRAGSRSGGPGLAEAFSRAGAGAVVSSLWQIEDEAARRFVCGFLDELKGSRDIAGAIRSARMKAISEAREKGDLSANIGSWAPFTLIAPFPRRDAGSAASYKSD